MPNELAIAASAAGSGRTSWGGIVVVPVAGVPTARVNLSNPPGMCTVRNQARCRCSRTAIASLTLVFQDVQASGCVLPAGADAYQRAHEAHRRLNLRCEDCRCARRAVVLLKGHAPNQTPVNPRGTKGQRRLCA